MSYTKGPWRNQGAKIVGNEWDCEEEKIPVTVVNLLGAMGGEDNGADRRLIVEAPTLLEEGYKLAMLGLQSVRYQVDGEYQDAVDNFLEVYKRVNENFI